MDLATFVAETLAGIQCGVTTAIAAAEQSRARGAINPVWEDVDGFAPEHVQTVTFDVAVIVTDKSSLSGGGGVQVVGIKVGGEKAGSNENSYVSRVQFTIPIVPPTTRVLRSK